MDVIPIYCHISDRAIIFPDLYRGGGGVARDGEYGYSMDIKERQVIGLFQLKLPQQQEGDEGESVQEEDRENITSGTSDTAEHVIRRKFQVRATF